MSLERLRAILDQCPFENIRNDFFHRDELSKDYSKQRSYFDSLSTKSEYGKSLIREINDLPHLDIFNSSMLNTGNGASRIEKDNLAAWLSWRSFKTSPDEAFKDLEKYLITPYNAGSHILAISGLSFSEKIEILDGIFIMPITALPSSAYKMELIESMDFSFNFGRIRKLPAVKTALFENSSFEPKFLSNDNLTPGKIIPLNPRAMIDICLCFNLIDQACPTPVMHWTQVNDNVPCAFFSGYSASIPMHDVPFGFEYNVGYG